MNSCTATRRRRPRIWVYVLGGISLLLSTPLAVQGHAAQAQAGASTSGSSQVTTATPQLASVLAAANSTADETPTGTPPATSPAQSVISAQNAMDSGTAQSSADVAPALAGTNAGPTPPASGLDTQTQVLGAVERTVDRVKAQSAGSRTEESLARLRDQAGEAQSRADRLVDARTHDLAVVDARLRALSTASAAPGEPDSG